MGSLIAASSTLLILSNFVCLHSIAFQRTWNTLPRSKNEIPSSHHGRKFPDSKYSSKPRPNHVPHKIPKNRKIHLDEATPYTTAITLEPTTPPVISAVPTSRPAQKLNYSVATTNTKPTDTTTKVPFQVPISTGTFPTFPDETPSITRTISPAESTITNKVPFSVPISTETSPTSPNITFSISKPEKPMENGAETKVIFFIGGGAAIAFVFLGVVLLFINERRRRLAAVEEARKILFKKWTKKIIIEMRQSQDESYQLHQPREIPVVKIEAQEVDMAQDKLDSLTEYELPKDDHWEYPRNNLTLGKTLGEGNFGKVVMAEARFILPGKDTSAVAVKMLKDFHTDSDMVDLVQEMEIMKMIRKHTNVLNMLGCCTQHGPLYVILEYAPHGNLRDFLRLRRPTSGYEPAIGMNLIDEENVSQKKLLSFSYQIAKGMEYLASRRVVFWHSPMGDHASLGGIPYSSVARIENLLDMLKSGYRMDKPPDCSSEVYEIMRDCWSYHPSERPTFSDLVSKLGIVLAKVTGEEYYVDFGISLGAPQADSEEINLIDNKDSDYTFELMERNKI